MADQNERPWYLGLLEQRVQLGDNVGAGSRHRGLRAATG